MKRLVSAVKNTILAMAEALERTRRNMIIFRYQVLHARASKQSISNSLNAVMPDFRRYTAAVDEIKTLVKERKALLTEKKATPLLQIPKHHELAKRISTLTEDIEELVSEKNILLSQFEKTDDAGMEEVRRWVDAMEASLEKCGRPRLSTIASFKPRWRSIRSCRSRRRKWTRPS